MARSDRLFDIIQILRLSRRPVTATAMAAELEVTPRTVYRDIAILQARRVPIDGAVGLGYMLRPGFDLPGQMFSEDEVEAIAVALRLLHRTGDPGLMNAAVGVAGKLAAAMPEALRNQFAGSSFRRAGRRRLLLPTLRRCDGPFANLENFAWTISTQEANRAREPSVRSR